MTRAHGPARLITAMMSVLALSCGGPEPRATRVVEPPGPSPSAARASARRAATARAAAPSPEVAAVPAAAPDSASSKTESLARAFVELQRRLAPFASEEDVTSATYDVRVPAVARPLLRELKRRGGEVVQARLGELIAAGRGDEVPEALSAAVLEPFTRAGAVAEYQAQVFGTLDGVYVSKLAGDDRMYGAVIALGLSCGSDSTLFVYRAEASGLTHLLTAATDDYASISDGQLALTYGVSPRDERGDFYVVTAHATPWCSSAWRSLEYRAYAPSGDPERPRRLVTGKSDVWIGDGLAQLDVGRDRFEVGFTSWDRLGMNVTRAHRHAYERHGAAFRPTTPAFDDAADLANAWISLDWDRAKHFVVPERQQKLRGVHARWKAGASADSGELTVEKTASQRAVVRFACDDCSQLPRRARFLVEKRDRRWQLVDVR